jgi:hypothetical protein
LLPIDLLCAIDARQRRTDTYYEQVKEALGKGLVLKKLTEDIEPVGFKDQSNPASRALQSVWWSARALSRPTFTSVDLKDESDPDSAETELDAPIKQVSVASSRSTRSTRRGSNGSQSSMNHLIPAQDGTGNPTSQTREQPARTVDFTEAARSFHLPWKKFDLDASLIQHSFITVCGSRKLDSEDAAKVAADLIYGHYVKQDQASITRDDFNAKLKESPLLATAAWCYLNPSDQASLTQAALQETLVAIYNERKFLTRNLQSLESLFAAANTFFNVLIGFGMFFFFLFAFNNSSVGHILVSFSALSVAISFSFGETAKNIFNSFIFVFVRHAFDAGDYVAIPEDSDGPMHVQRIHLLTTTFRRRDNRVVDIPNHVLYNHKILNLRRSTNLRDIFTLDVDVNVSMELIQKLESGLKTYLSTLADDFDAKGTCVLCQTLQLGDKVVLEIFVSQHSNWHYRSFHHRRHLIIGL